MRAWAIANRDPIGEAPRFLRRLDEQSFHGVLTQGAFGHDRKGFASRRALGLTHAGELARSLIRQEISALERPGVSTPLIDWPAQKLSKAHTRLPAIRH